jgi:hypothetical protein
MDDDPLVTTYLYSAPSGWDPEITKLHILMTVFYDMSPAERSRAIEFLKSRFVVAE